jgi:predicted AAA+ superfamily ATPase
MTDGTFVLLCDDVQCFTTNEDNWDLVKASVSGNILTIESQNVSSTATISWMVIGDRKDQHMFDTSWTDENGKVIVEPERITGE